MKIEEILESTRRAVRTAKESDDMKEVISTSLRSLAIYSQNREGLPKSFLKQLIEDVNGDLAASAVYRGIEAGLFDMDDPDFKTLLQIANTAHDLNNVTKEKRGQILLTAAEEGFNKAYMLASAVGLVDVV